MHTLRQRACCLEAGDAYVFPAEQRVALDTVYVPYDMLAGGHLALARVACCDVDAAVPLMSGCDAGARRLTHDRTGKRDRAAQ